MAVTVNIDSQIVVKTAAQWAADSTVYSAKRILVTSDEYYGATDQRKFKIANGTDTWSNLDYMPIGAGGASGLLHGTATQVSAGVYTTTISGVTAYTTGDVYAIKFTSVNDNGSTININSLGAVNIYKNSIVPLESGDIKANQEIIIVYDGTNFQAIGLTSAHLLAYVHNAEGSVISKGQVVYAFGSSGNKMSVKLARADADATSAKTIGIVYDSTIGIGAEGYIIIQGAIVGVNTAAYSAGDTLYLSASTFGGLTNVKPYAPDHLVYVGIVERANAGNGQIYVRCQNGYELDEIHNVDLITTPPVNNDVLTYNSSSQLWSAKSINTILPNAVTGTGTANQITYWATSGTVGSLNTTTYPSLTELSYVKGTTSAIQTQLNGKQATLTNPVTGTGTNNELAAFNSTGSTITSLTTATYPSLTELSHVKGVTSAIQTQLNGKQATLTNPVTGTGTNNEIAVFNSTGSTITSLATTTYPSLTELSYVKGVTSAIQTQINGKITLDDVIFTVYALYGGAAPLTDGSVWHFSNGANAPTAGNTAANNDSFMPYSCTLQAAVVNVSSNTTAGTNENQLWELLNVTQNTTATIGNIQTNGASATVTTTFNFTGLSLAFTAGDTWVLRCTNPTWATNPVGSVFRVLLFFKRV